MIELFHSDLLVPALCIFLVSSMLQGATGFGMGLIAIPLLTLLLDPKIVVPATTIASMAVSLMIIVQLHQHCDWRRAAWLGVPALLTAPLGVHLLKILTSRQLCTGLGVVLIASASVSLWQRWRSGRTTGSAAPNTDIRPVGSVAVGSVSGVIGGALGMTGPLLADYLNKSGIRPEEFRITLNLIFVASSTWRTGLYVARDILTGQTLWLALAAVPAVILGATLGSVLGRRIRREAFTVSINWFLLLIGIAMLLQGRH
jgi:uncharacterized membrane protein YfcA